MALRALLGLFGDNTLRRCDGLLKFRDTTDLLKTRLNGAFFSFGNNRQDIRGSFQQRDYLHSGPARQSMFQVRTV